MRFQWADSLVSPSFSAPPPDRPGELARRLRRCLVNSCGRLKLDINYVINSKWRTTMFCLQVCWLLLHSFKSILLFLTTNASHFKRIQIVQSFSSRRGLVRPLRFKPRQRWFWGRPARASAWWDNVLGQRTSRHGHYARYSPFADLL